MSIASNRSIFRFPGFTVSNFPSSCDNSVTVQSGDLLSILLIAIGLSADCFAVSLSSSIAHRNHSWIQILRVALAFGFFQGAMPVLGWFAGQTVVDFIAAFDHWLAFGLLTAISGKMLWEAFHKSPDEKEQADNTRGLILLTLAVATSIDALAVGLSFAFLQVNIACAAPVIGAVSFAVTILGFLLGKKAGKLAGKQSEVIGALILFAIGLRILLTHLFGQGSA
jgi:putative Mn2+ efflux pump MntP